MKKILLALVLFTSVSFSAFAQQESSSEKSANLMSRVMAAQLNLNNIQVVQLEVMNRERFKKSDLIAEMYKDEPTILKAKIAELENNFEKKLFGLLTKSQIAIYSEWKTAATESQLAMQEKK